MAQVSSMTAAQAKSIVPVGPGGVPGRIFRMVVMVCTGGFIYPNTFVEGMDLTAIQNEHQGVAKQVKI